MLPCDVNSHSVYSYCPEAIIKRARQYDSMWNEASYEFCYQFGFPPHFLLLCCRSVSVRFALLCICLILLLLLLLLLCIVLLCPIEIVRSIKINTNINLHMDPLDLLWSEIRICQSVDATCKKFLSFSLLGCWSVMVNVDDGVMCAWDTVKWNEGRPNWKSAKLADMI